MAKRRAEKGVVTKIAMEKLSAVKAFEDEKKKKKSKLAKQLKGNTEKKATVLTNIRQKKKTMNEPATKSKRESDSGTKKVLKKRINAKGELSFMFDI